MIIGVGEDGQIGFNEPGSYAKSRTRLVQLTHNTRKIQSGAFFGLENTPKMAITMGIDTIMRAEKIILMAWGEEKAKIVQKVVEGEVTSQVPASNLQMHPNIEVVIDENAAQMLTREQTPWLVGPCKWTPKFTRKAVVWLCGVVQKPILKLTYKDYIENSLGELLEQGRAYDQINIDVFNACSTPSRAGRAASPTPTIRHAPYRRNRSPSAWWYSRPTPTTTSSRWAVPLSASCSRDTTYT